MSSSFLPIHGFFYRSQSPRDDSLVWPAEFRRLGVRSECPADTFLPGEFALNSDVSSVRVNGGIPWQDRITDLGNAVAAWHGRPVDPALHRANPTGLMAGVVTGGIWLPTTSDTETQLYFREIETLSADAIRLSEIMQLSVICRDLGKCSVSLSIQTGGELLFSGQQICAGIDIADRVRLCEQFAQRLHELLKDSFCLTINEIDSADKSDSSLLNHALQSALVVGS